MHALKHPPSGGFFSGPVTSSLPYCLLANMVEGSNRKRYNELAMKFSPLFWKRFNIALAFLVLVGILQLLAAKYNLYYHQAWYDIMMHFLGGVTVGLALVSLATLTRPITTRRQLLWYIFWGIIAVGMAWEIFEHVANIQETFGPTNLPDTGLDLVMDTIGAFVAIIPFTNWFKNPLSYE